MRRFRKWFALLFVLSILITVIHEHGHGLFDDEPCEICLLSHTPAILDAPLAALSIDPVFESFPARSHCQPVAASLACRSRSPPLS